MYACDTTRAILTNFFGLNWRAVRWLQDSVDCQPCIETVTRDFDGHIVTLPPRNAYIPWEYETGIEVKGTFGELVHTLKRYKLHAKNHNPVAYVEEFIQSQGIRQNTSDEFDIFLGLRFADTKKVIKASLWSDAEINRS